MSVPSSLVTCDRPAVSSAGATLAVASVGCAFTVLDSNVVGIVLPAIASDLGARFAELQWVVGSYALSFAALLLPAGSIADRFGRKRIFLVGIAVFGLASMLCGLVPSIAWLSAARALQGGGAAFLLSPALEIIGQAFQGETERRRAWAAWGGLMGLTMVTAPILGGLVSTAFGWRWAFLMNVPICLALAAAAVPAIVESRRDPAPRLDLLGIVVFAAAMFSLTFGLVNGQDRGWTSPSAVLGFGAGALWIVAFLRAERSRSDPMLDLDLFRSPALVGAVVAMFAYASSAQVMASLLPQFLQNGLGLSPLAAGFGMLPFSLAMLAFPSVGGRLQFRRPGAMLVTGLLVVSAGCATIALGARLGAMACTILGMLVLGAGGGLLNGETQRAIMASIPPERAGMASGIGTTARFTGILLSYALLTAVLASAVRSGLAGTSGADFADAVAAGGLEAATKGWDSAARDLAAVRVGAAYMSGFAMVLAVASVLAAGSALLVRHLLRRNIGAPLQLLGKE